MNLYKFVVGSAAFIIAAMAALFSITGLALLFSGAYLWVAIAMGGLEFGKIVVASFLYRFWGAIPRFLSPYLITGLIVLMLITSIGIFGYLTNAYQGMSVQLDKTLQKKEVLIAERTRLNTDKERLITEKKELSDIMNKEISELVIKEETRYLDSKWRNRIVQRYQPTIEMKESQITAIAERLATLSAQIGDVEIEAIDTGVDVGPIVFVARFFNTSVDAVARTLIFVIIFVFDPMAISLVFAYNIVYDKEEKDKKAEEKNRKERERKKQIKAPEAPEKPKPAPIRIIKEGSSKPEEYPIEKAVKSFEHFVKSDQSLPPINVEPESELEPKITIADVEIPKEKIVIDEDIPGTTITPTTRIEEKDEGGVRRIEQVEMKDEIYEKIEHKDDGKEITIEEVLEEQLNPSKITPHQRKKVIIPSPNNDDHRLP